MLIKDVMTRLPASCKPSDTIGCIAALMLKKDCGVIPVCDGDAVVGIVTDRDITLRAVARGISPELVTAADVMSAPVYAVREDEDAQTAIDLMEEKQVRRLPVLNAEGKLAGIIAPSDLAPIFASMNVSDFLLAVSYWTRKPAAA